LNAAGIEDHGQRSTGLQLVNQKPRHAGASAAVGKNRELNAGCTHVIHGCAGKDSRSVFIFGR
jgi:hypothetical protein